MRGMCSVDEPAGKVGASNAFSIWSIIVMIVCFPVFPLLMLKQCAAIRSICFPISCDRGFCTVTSNNRCCSVINTSMTHNGICMCWKFGRPIKALIICYATLLYPKSLASLKEVKRLTFFPETDQNSLQTLPKKCWSCETTQRPPVHPWMAPMSASTVSRSK